MLPKYLKNSFGLRRFETLIVFHKWQKVEAWKSLVPENDENSSTVIFTVTLTHSFLYETAAHC